MYGAISKEVIDQIGLRVQTIVSGASSLRLLNSHPLSSTGNGKWVFEFTLDNSSHSSAMRQPIVMQVLKDQLSGEVGGDVEILFDGEKLQLIVDVMVYVQQSSRYGKHLCKIASNDVQQIRNNRLKQQQQQQQQGGNASLNPQQQANINQRASSPSSSSIIVMLGISSIILFALTKMSLFTTTDSTMGTMI